MYSHIRGSLTTLTPSYAVIEASGIGYKIFIPTRTFTSLSPQNPQVLLYTAFVIREFFQGLYGFIVEEERNLFETLIDISGVGPKTALSLIGHFSVATLNEVVINEDTQALSQVPGIGKKTAERLLIELRNKLETFFTKNPQVYSINASPDQQNKDVQDAIKALLHLGYNYAIAHKAMKKTLETITSRDLSLLITTALKHV